MYDECYIIFFIYNNAIYMVYDEIYNIWSLTFKKCTALFIILLIILL